MYQKDVKKHINFAKKYKLFKWFVFLEKHTHMERDTGAYE